MIEVILLAHDIPPVRPLILLNEVTFLYGIRAVLLAPVVAYRGAIRELITYCRRGGEYVATSELSIPSFQAFAFTVPLASIGAV